MIGLQKAEEIWSGKFVLSINETSCGTIEDFFNLQRGLFISSVYFIVGILNMDEKNQY